MGFRILWFFHEEMGICSQIFNPEEWEDYIAKKASSKVVYRGEPNQEIYQDWKDAIIRDHELSFMFLLGYDEARIKQNRLNCGLRPIYNK